jgi:hypothetical protein
MYPGLVKRSHGRDNSCVSFHRILIYYTLEGIILWAAAKAFRFDLGKQACMEGRPLPWEIASSLRIITLKVPMM